MNCMIIETQIKESFDDEIFRPYIMLCKIQDIMSLNDTATA